MSSKASFIIGPLLINSGVFQDRLPGHWNGEVHPALSQIDTRGRSDFEIELAAKYAAAEMLRRSWYSAQVGNLKAAEVGLLFDALAKRWMKFVFKRVELDKTSASTANKIVYHLQNLRRFFGQLEVQAIREDELMDYQSHRRTQGIAPATINGELGTFRQMMRWAAKNKWIDEVPSTDPLRRQRRHIDLPTQGEVSRIIGCLPMQLRPLVLLMAVTGCRSGEAFHLTWDDVDVSNGLIHIRPKDNWRPKTAYSERTLYVDQDLMNLIQNLPRQSQWVFPGRDPIKPISNFKKALETAIRKAGVKRSGVPIHLSPHIFRKAHNSWLATAGIPLHVRQSLMGHAPGSRVTDEYYALVSEDERRNAVLSLDL